MKFNNGDNSFYTTLKQRVEQYFSKTGKSKFGGSGIILKALIMFSLYIAPFVLILTLNAPWWLYLIFALVIGVAKAGIGFCVMHDSIHGTFSANKKINRIVSHSSYLIGAAIFPWKVKHNILHHTYTNVHGMDHDIESKALLRLSFKAPLWWVHRYQYIYAFFFYMFTSLAFLVGDFVDLLQYKKKGLIEKYGSNFNQEFFMLILFRLVYLGIFISLPMVFVDLPWWGILLGFLFIHFVAGLILSSVFQMAHLVEGTEQPDANENGQLDFSWALHQLHTTANFAMNNRLIGWYTGGLNHQVEHHLLPNVSHVHYSELSKIVRQTAEEYDFPYHTKKTFRSALWSHVSVLRNLGRKKDEN